MKLTRFGKASIMLLVEELVKQRSAARRGIMNETKLCQKQTSMTVWVIDIPPT